MGKKSAIELYGVAKFALFATSYAPLFVLVIGKQVNDNWDFMYFGGWNVEAIKCFFSKFFVTTILLFVLFFGIMGCIFLFSNLRNKKGDSVVVTKVSNRNSESMGYVASYIIPFVFQSFNSIYEVISIFFIFLITYCIYVNSNMLLINPLLNVCHYSIFEIQFRYKEEEKSGLVILHNSIIEEKSRIKIYPIGFKLYYANN